MPSNSRRRRCATPGERSRRAEPRVRAITTQRAHVSPPSSTRSHRRAVSVADDEQLINSRAFTSSIHLLHQRDRRGRRAGPRYPHLRQLQRRSCPATPHALSPAGERRLAPLRGTGPRPGAQIAAEPPGQAEALVAAMQADSSISSMVLAYRRRRRRGGGTVPPKAEHRLGVFEPAAAADIDRERAVVVVLPIHDAVPRTRRLVRSLRQLVDR